MTASEFFFRQVAVAMEAIGVLVISMALADSARRLKAKLATGSICIYKDIRYKRYLW